MCSIYHDRRGQLAKLYKPLPRKFASAADDLGMTPLLYSVWRGDERAVGSLLSSGADPNKPQRGDWAATPLWHAEDDFGLFEIAALLRAFGARK